MWILFMVTVLGQSPIDKFSTREKCEVQAKAYRAMSGLDREAYVCEKGV